MPVQSDSGTIQAAQLAIQPAAAALEVLTLTVMDAMSYINTMEMLVYQFVVTTITCITLLAFQLVIHPLLLGQTMDSRHANFLVQRMDICTGMGPSLESSK